MAAQITEGGRSRMRKWMWLLLAGCIAVTVCIGCVVFGDEGSPLVGKHPVFGNVYQTSAYDIEEVRSKGIVKFLRAVFPGSITRSWFLPKGLRDKPGYFKVGNYQLEWSRAGSSSGYIYFWGVDGGNWEFARATGSEFSSVTEVPSEFYSADHPERALALPNSSKNALKFNLSPVIMSTMGDIGRPFVFARNTLDTKTVYLMNIVSQQENRAVLHYCVISQ